MERIKGKLIFLLFLVTLLFVSCDNNAVNSHDITPKTTTLKITNLSSYILHDVKYSSIEFGDIIIGGNKTVNVTPSNVNNPVFFNLSINGNPVQCRTNDIKSIAGGSTDDWIIYNATTISTVSDGITGTISSVYNILSKPILEFSQNNNIIENNNPIAFDFGEVELDTNEQRIFTIKNTGNLPLELSGSPVIESSNSVFSVPSQPVNTTIAPGASVSFIIRYTPTSEKEDTGTITIFNNSDALFYILNIKGKGYEKKPQITVNQGDTSIIQSGEFNFGSVTIGEHKDIIFNIGNTGDANLVFETVNNNRINLENNINDFYTVTTQPSSVASIAPGNTTTFTIRFSPQTAGSDFNAIVKIKTNSRDNDEFSFAVKGSSVLSAPIGIIVTAQSTNSINLSWNPVQGATGYNIYYGTSYYAINILAGSNITETSYVHTGLSAGTTYHYCITALNGLSESNRSLAVSGLTLPGIPSNLRSTSVNDNSITLAWNSVTGATNYRVYTASSPEGSKTQIGQVNSVSYTHSGLSADTIHYYFVTAINNSGEGEFTEVFSEKTLLAPLSAPANVTATALSTSSIEVTWGAVTDAAGYRIYRATSSAGTRTLLDTVTATSYTSGGLQARAYWYFITALNTDNIESTLSAPTSMVPFPNVPSNVSASGFSNWYNGIGINVNYNSVAGADSYRVYLATSLTGTRTLVVSGTTYSPNTTYFFWVTAVNAAGESDYSIHTSAVTPPSVPVNVRATANTTTSITFAWNAVTGATRYDIYFNNWLIGSHTGTSFMIYDLNPNTGYNFEVVAFNGSTGLSSGRTQNLIAWTR
ncbi:MAG: fibronectin type III domain-containing protein [Treponema sp.]|nr:fibronectin type III domain-containing protein [Treponema sp.]